MKSVFGWIQNNVQKIADKLIDKGPVSDNPRLGQYIDFRLDQGIMNYITIDNTRLYYEAYNPQEKVQTLQEQFEKFHKRELSLESKEVKISPQMPLCEILNSSQSREIFEDIVCRLDKKQQIKTQTVQVQKRQIFQKIIKTCNDFSNYQCKIYMNYSPQSPLKVELTIDQNTTFNKIIKDMNSHPHVIGEDIVFSNSTKKYQVKHYKQTFKALNIRDLELYANYSTQNSFIRGNTKIVIPEFQGGLEMHKILQEGIQKIISYDAEKYSFIVNKIVNSQQKVIKQYYKIFLCLKTAQDKEVVLQCTGSVRIFVLTSNFDQIWVPANQLKLDDQVGGIDPQKGSFAIYKVKYIQIASLQVPQIFLGIEVSPKHQYIANNIIVHNNNDKFFIKAHYIKGKDKTLVKEIQFKRNQPLNDIFKNKICKVGGNILKNSQTFGDYQLQQIKTIYVFEDEQSLKMERRQYTISEWKEKTIDHQQIQPQYERKLQQEYLGIYAQRIVHPKEIKEIYEKQSTSVNILVGIRTYFERLNYLMKKQPKYAQFEPQEHKKYWEKKQDDEHLKSILAKLQKEKCKISREHVLGMFLYTCNDIYYQMNGFLRDKYSKDILLEERKFLPLAGWIWKSMRKAQIYQGTVYRGINNIDIGKAFKLKSGQINKDKVIIFTSFSSASTSKSAAQNFAKEPSSLILTIKVSSGRDIQKYSRYSNEKQVLLLPFTYFVINSYSIQTSKQTADIQQIPMPQTDSKRIIFWVDDQPKNNEKLIKYCFERQEIEVVQITTTRIMKIILQNFLWIFKMLGKKVVIISDMLRYEQGKKNQFAGVDLFQHIYNQYGLSNKAIIFTSKRNIAYQKLAQRNIKPGNWAITQDENDLVRQVMDQFRKMQ